jgi:hypothetical protein
MSPIDPPGSSEPAYDAGAAGGPPRPVNETGMFETDPVRPPPTSAQVSVPFLPPPPPPPPPPGGEPHPPAGGGQPRADANAEIISYEAIREQCWMAHGRRQTIIAVLGLPASGKTFFIQRLRESHRSTHDYRAYRGLPQAWGARIERTTQILLTSLRPKVRPDSRGAIHLFDVPGDFIAPLVRGGFQPGSDPYNRLAAILLVLSMADAVVFVAPALQVLNRRLFIEDGDDEALRAPATPDAPRRRADRVDRVDDLERFITSLQFLRDLLQPLRETLAVAERNARRGSKVGEPVDPKAVLDQAIAGVLATPFEKRETRIVRPMRLPLMMLLSRADELKRRGGAAVDDAFDLDPAWQVIQCHSEYFDNLSGFESFCVDFLTAQRGENPERVIDDKVEGFGADGLLRGWLARTIADSRRPAWLGALRSPRMATRLRRWLDPDFPGIRR